MSPSKSDELENALATMERVRSQIEAYAREVEVLEVGINEHLRAKSTLTALTTTKNGTELLVPIGAGAYAFAKADATDTVLVSLGSGVRIEEDVPAAIGRIDTRLETIRQRQQRMIAELRQLENAAESLNERIESMARGGQREKQAGTPAGK